MTIQTNAPTLLAIAYTFATTFTEGNLLQDDGYRHASLEQPSARHN